MDINDPAEQRIVGGVDTHKDLHVAAVVDERDRVLGTQSFATTRKGYRQMLAWMRSFGEVQRIGIECTGSYGAGLLRFVQVAGIEVLEVTTPDRTIGDAPPLLTSGLSVILCEGSGDKSRDDAAAGSACMRESVPHEVDAAALPHCGQHLGDGRLDALVRV